MTPTTKSTNCTSRTPFANNPLLRVGACLLPTININIGCTRVATSQKRPCNTLPETLRKWASPLQTFDFSFKPCDAIRNIPQHKNAHFRLRAGITRECCERVEVALEIWNPQYCNKLQILSLAKKTRNDPGKGAKEKNLSIRQSTLRPQRISAGFYFRRRSYPHYRQIFPNVPFCQTPDRTGL